MLAAWPAFSGGWAAGGQQPLAVEGRAAAVVVLPDTALPRGVESVAARVLVDHLRQMSGARLEVRRERELGQVDVRGGQLASEPGKLGPGVQTFVLVGEGELARKLGLTSEGLGPGGLLIKSSGNALALLGPAGGTDPDGTLHAVIGLLEELGCRYLWPGELGKVVPKQSTVSVGPLDRQFTPPIGQRRIRWAGMSERPQRGLESLRLSREEWERGQRQALAAECDISWLAWHGLGGDLGLHGGHAAAGLQGGWAEHGKTHPEWFALQADGTRDQSAAGDRFRLCKSNPELIDHVARGILKRLKENPRLSCVSLSPNDGGYSSFCICESCKRLDPPNAPKIKLFLFDKVGQARRKEIEYVSLTDRMVYYWNSVAERVVKESPHVLFVVDAYSCYSEPPVLRKLHPNLVVRYVPDKIDGWEGWKRAGAKRIYWRPNILLAGRRDGQLHVMVSQLAETMRALAEGGMTATDFDSIIHNWAVHGLNYYAAARLCWDPRRTAEEIIGDYCRCGFAAAAEHVQRYFLRIQEITLRQNRQFSDEAVAALRACLDDAGRAARGDETILARLDFLRLGLNFTELQLALDRMAEAAAAGKPADRSRARQLMDLNYLVLRDIVRHHHLAVNAAYLMWGSGNYAKWRPLGWNGRPSEGLLDQPGQPARSLTGRENSIAEMLQVMGLSP